MAERVEAEPAPESDSILKTLLPLLVGENWYMLGLALGLPPERLDQIENATPAVKLLHSVIAEWIKRGGSGQRTWSSIFEALKAIEYNVLMSRLQKSHKPTDEVSATAAFELEEIAAEWKSFGIQLDLQPALLDQLQLNPDKDPVDIKMQKMMALGFASGKASLQGLIAALKIRGNMRLAGKIEEKYLKRKSQLDKL